MESRVNYTQVGLFVVISTIILIIGGVWLSVGVYSTDYTTYAVHMHESVSGLSVRAPVKYNGVDVGYVKSMDLRTGRPDEVTLLLDIKSQTPVSVETRAILESQGLTGIAFMELTGGSPHSKPLQRRRGEPYPVISSSPSLYFRLDAALDDLTTNLNNISDGLTAVLNEENAKAIHATLANIESVSKTLNDNTSVFSHIMKNTDITMSNAATASEKLPQVMSSIESGARSVKTLTSQLADAGTQADRVLRGMHTSVQTLNDQLLPGAVNTLGDFQSLISNLNTVSQDLVQNPSVLIRGKTPPPLGPGEK